MAKTPVKKEETKTPAVDPFQALRSEVDRLFEGFSRPFSELGRGIFEHEPFKGFALTSGVKTPRVDVAETDKAFEISAELPGMDEKDVNVSLADGVLTIKGEKKEEKETKEKNYHLVERSYGSFQRSFRIPDNVNEGKVSAEVSKGILKVTLPKNTPTKKPAGEKKIEIKSR